MKKLALLLAVFFIFTGCGKKDEGKKISTEIPKVLKSSIGGVKIDFDILPDIQKAQSILEKEKAGYYVEEEERIAKEDVKKSNVKGKIKGKGKGKNKGKKKKPRTWKIQKLADYNVLLAVENVSAKNRNIEVVKLGNKGRTAPNGFSVDFDRSNGVNTEFKITYPKNYVVLAMKRVVKAGKGFKEVVYTPYTKEINTPELRKVGFDYLKNNLNQAHEEMKVHDVKSHAFKGLVVDAVPSDVALVLSLIEHIDPARFKRGEPMEQLVNEVLVIVGANQGRAYQYAVSSAGARGLFQFIPRTYHAIQARYPKARLKKDFAQGMNDHLNGAKASLLLFDSDLSYLNLGSRDRLKNDPKFMGQYLAAAYNCGAGRTVRTIQNHRDWKNKLPNETCDYLRKFDAVWKIIYT